MENRNGAPVWLIYDRTLVTYDFTRLRILTSNIAFIAGMAFLVLQKK